MMAALAAAENGCQVTLLEKNEKLGKKIYITGKGRCNLTNSADVDTLLANVVTNRKFLYSAFYGFTNRDMMELLEHAGLKLKTERGGRVFPASDKSSDVIRTLQRELEAKAVEIRLGCAVKSLLVERPDDENGSSSGEETAAKEGETAEKAGMEEECKAGRETEKQADGRRDNGQRNGKKEKKEQKLRGVCTGVKLETGEICRADRVIVACGGLSYPSTGSTGDGHRFARECGHTITELSPALVPFCTQEEWVPALQGLSLRNVEVKISRGKKVFYQEFGEMLFTHFGVSGPAVLSGSSVTAKELKKGPLTLTVDLKPALDREQLDQRLLRDFKEFQNKQFKNSLGQLLPAKLIPVVVERSCIDPERQVNSISRAERERLTELLKNFTLTLTGLRGYNEAIITQGGISVKEVDPATMESRLVEHLYFAGEELDVDAMTGGYNLQIAWSTGYAAGRSCGG